MTVGELKKIFDRCKDTDEVVVDADDQYAQNLPVVEAWEWGGKVYICCYEEEEEEPDEDDSIDRSYDDWLDDRMEEMYGEK